MQVTLVFVTSQQHCQQLLWNNCKNCHEEKNCFISQPKGMELETWKNTVIIGTGGFHYFDPYIFWDVLFKMTWISVVAICYQMNTWSLSSLKFILIMYLTIPKLVMVGLNSVRFFSCLTITAFLPPWKIYSFLIYFIFWLIQLCIRYGFNIKFEDFFGGGWGTTLSTTPIWLSYYLSLIIYSTHS